MMDTLDEDMDLTTASSDSAWLDQLASSAEDGGMFTPLGAHHAAYFADGNNSLLVSFESVDAIRRSEPGHEPLGLRIAKRHDWSSLVMLARAPRWYRDPDLLDFFDAQIDAGFFDEFERVFFYGAGMGGYAACALSLSAPGATVLAIAPQATLDPHIAPWEHRFRPARRFDFNSRFGFAPAMLDGARNAFIVYDSARRTDAMHATLFQRPFVTLLRAAHLDGPTDAALRRMDVLDTLIETAARGRLTPARFRDMLRKRREDPRYLNGLAKRTAQAGHPALTAIAARHALMREDSRGARKRLDWAERMLAHNGV